MIVEKKYISEIKDFEECKELWNELEKGCEMTVYQSFEWNYLLVQEQLNLFMSKFFSKIIIYFVWDEERHIKAILPLIYQRIGNITKWFGRKKGIYILGHGSYSDYLNAIYGEVDEEILELLINTIKVDFGHMMVHFTDLIEGTMFEKCLDSIGIEKQKSDITVAIKRSESAEEYTKNLSKHVRQNLRTSLNRMKKDGVEYRYQIIWGNVEDIGLLNELRELHIMRMSEKNNDKTDIIHKISSSIRIHYRKNKERNNNIVYESMKSMKNSVFVIVYLNDQISGYLYGLKENKVIRIMQNCFNSEYKFYSPMFRGAYDFIVSMYENEDIDSIDFTRGEETYKYQLSGEATILKNYKGIIL